jgi:hypothetical protein
MKTLRASGATSESMPTIFTPRCAACLSAGATALGSLPAMMIALGFCCTAALMIGIWVDAPASVGPVIRFEPPSSLRASSMPECSYSSYGLPSCLGIETVFMPGLIGAFGLGAPASDVLAVPCADWVDDPVSELFLVSPQAARTNAASSASATSSAPGVRGRVDFMRPPLVVDVGVAGPLRRGVRGWDPGPSR